MDLTLRKGHWMSFYMKLVAVISLDNCYSQFHRPFCELVQEFSFHWWGNSSLLQTEWIRLWISPPAWISSAEIWSLSGHGWPPLWSSGQSFWLQIQGSGFDSRRYQIFWDVVGLQLSPLSLVSTFEELLERKSSGSDLEEREYGHAAPFADKQRSLSRYSSLAD
jgi:hypothetical protein